MICTDENKVIMWIKLIIFTAINRQKNMTVYGIGVFALSRKKNPQMRTKLNMHTEDMALHRTT